MTTLNEEKIELFNQKLNIFFNVNFLNRFKSYVNNAYRLNKSINLIKTKFKIKRRSNKVFKENMNTLKASK